MPHTSRTRRTTPQKRIQVTDNDGWTHVTSSSNVRRVMRTTTHRTNTPLDNNNKEEVKEEELVLAPAEAPSRLTLAQLQTQLEGHSEKWADSRSWAWVREVLLQSLAVTESVSSPAAAPPVEAIVCIGLGSPSGFLRGGWVDRRTVCLYQLAALVAIKVLVRRQQDRPVPVYAQDPVFNTLDRELLESLGITVVEHPAAFDLVTQHSVVFCPGAESKHLLQIFSSQPRILFCNQIDTIDPQFRSLLEHTRPQLMPDFPPCEEAFWRLALYVMHGDSSD
ncbi:hypothetical protein N7474_001706 [Penicillium riverlandense]|uniref:uncharacterized protein n=1 Tax=Penicillium riverlandense TaxID=1903569 RepID=UPI0025490B77|nr:uncharacterized protein N7474_001706 [Penicillium riverlandense]KAJ5833395.1 hypothetical protein N7474_001706 [Penicillium riverlandense]